MTSSVSRKRASQTAPIARARTAGCDMPVGASEVETGFEPVYTALQAVASPLGHSTERPRPVSLRTSPSGRRDSNPRPSPWQGDALPAALRPHATEDPRGASANHSRSLVTALQSQSERCRARCGRLALTCVRGRPAGADGSPRRAPGHRRWCEVTDDPARSTPAAGGRSCVTFEGALTCARFERRQGRAASPARLAWRGPAADAWTSLAGPAGVRRGASAASVSASRPGTSTRRTCAGS